MRKGCIIRRSWTAGCAERCLSGAGESGKETYCREAARRFLRLTSVYRAAVPPDRVPGFHECDARRVSAAGPALRGRLPIPYGGLADGWKTADRSSVYRVQKLPPADTARSAVLPAHVPEDLCPPGGARAPVWHGAGESPSVDSRPLARAAGGPACPRRRSSPLPDGPGAAPRHLRDR